MHEKPFLTGRLFLALDMKEELGFSTGEEQETAVLVAVTTQKQNAVQTAEYLAELAFLASTSGVVTLAGVYKAMSYRRKKAL